MEPGSPALQADALPSEPPWKPIYYGIPTTSHEKERGGFTGFFPQLLVVHKSLCQDSIIIVHQGFQL